MNSKKTIKNCNDWSELCQLLKNTDTNSLVSRDYTVVHRALEKCVKNSDVKIAYLGDHTMDILPKYVEVMCAFHGIGASSYLGPFDQYYQEILDPNSKLHAFKPDIIFLALTPRRLSPDVCGRFLELSGVERKQERQRVLLHIQNWVNLAKQHTEATMLVSNIVRPTDPQAGIADAKLEYSEAEWYLDLNLDLLRSFKQESRVALFDLDHALSGFGVNRSQDPKMVYLATMEWNEDCLPIIAKNILHYIIAVKGLTKKCLVVDLDNTIWGGVVGEEGADGVKIGKGYAEGEIFYDFQQVIRSLNNRGIILAICSKNNPDDAKEVFHERTEMPLKWEDFAATQINWEHKNKNLQEIASSLNIGIDSLVFVDDNPVERELIQSTLPQVVTIDLPVDPSGYMQALSRIPYFEKLLITDEDFGKAKQYQQNAKRQEFKAEIDDINSFLESLATELTIELAAEAHIPRVHQLFSKTNQFNVTTKRYSVADIEGFILTTEWDLRIASVKDKFGDLGIVGLYLVKKQKSSGYIDSFILSCRVMGRGLETAMMNNIKSHNLLKGGIDMLGATYLPTAKNKPVFDFFESQDFIVSESLDDGAKEYGLKVEDTHIKEHPGITVKLEEG